MHNRRNLYRLLHVQRDAPTAVIKGSFRTLMQTLRQHPDLGGDEWNAQLLNQARDILCDPIARAEYDAAMLEPGAARAAPSPGAGPAPVDRACCHYCRADTQGAPGARAGYAPSERCRRCGAPTRKPVITPNGGDVDERRGLHRMSDDATVTIQRHWPDNDRVMGRLLEFSIAGCAFESLVTIPREEILLLGTDVFTATGVVRTSVPVSGRRVARIGIEFLSVVVHTSPGALFSASA